MASKKSKSALSQQIVGAGLSQEATNILVGNLSAKTIAGAAGAGMDAIATDEVTLACVVFDETGSMEMVRDEVIKDFEMDLDAIRGSSQADQILMSLWAFNTKTRLIHSYLPLDLVDGLTDYHPDDMTALYDAVLEAFTSLVAYEEELKKQGIRTKINLAVFSDGEDNASHATAVEVAKVASDLVARENVTLTFTGFVDTQSAEQIAKEMGFNNYMAVGSADAKGRRRAFGTWSESVIASSQSKIGGSNSILTP